MKGRKGVTVTSYRCVTSSSLKKGRFFVGLSQHFYNWLQPATRSCFDYELALFSSSSPTQQNPHPWEFIRSLNFCSFCLQIIQFCYVWRLILQWNRLIELLAYIFSMVYVVDDLQLDDTSFTISEGSRQVNINNNNNNNNNKRNTKVFIRQK